MLYTVVMEDIAIRASGLVIEKQKQSVLNGIDLVIKRATINGLIGPSGSGKTTLMRAIVGVQSYRGNLEVLGQAAGSAGLRDRIGYVTQSPAIYGDLSVWQNLCYFAVINKATREQARAIMTKVQLASRADQLVASLSGGQRARVNLAVALLGNPDLLVFDEPTVGLDPILRQELWGLFKELAASGKTLLISSHVMDEAERCDNLILIRDGKVLWNDTRVKLLENTHSSTVGAAFIAKTMEVE